MRRLMLVEVRAAFEAAAIEGDLVASPYDWGPSGQRTSWQGRGKA